MDNQQYPALEQFLGGYFHQDFMLDYGNPDGAVAAFMSEERTETVQAVCRNLDEVIPMIEKLGEPEMFLWRNLGCYYLPKADGLTVADWLRHVRTRLCGNRGDTHVNP